MKAQLRRMLSASIQILAISVSLWGQSASPPLRWQAQYTQIYSDDIENTAPVINTAFLPGAVGSLTSVPSEVFAGKTSFKAAYTGSATNTIFLETSPQLLPLAANHSYKISFQYKILVAPDKPLLLPVFFAHGGSAEQFSDGRGNRGRGWYNGNRDYHQHAGELPGLRRRLDHGGTGATSIDNIQITDTSTGKVVATEDVEGINPTIKPGLTLWGGASVVADASRVLAGKSSLLINGQQGFRSNPAVLLLGANTVYTVKFDYRILARGTADVLFYSWLQPDGLSDQQGQALQITLPDLLKNAETTGTFFRWALRPPEHRRTFWNLRFPPGFL